MRTKFLLIFLLCLCWIFRINAQFNAGRYMLGGGFNMYTVKNARSPDSKATSVNTNIQFGKMVKENTFVGVILSYGHLNSVTSGIYPDTNKMNNYGAGIFFQKI